MPMCPVCQADYSPGASRCHDCDVELVDAAEGTPEPRDPQGPETLVTIASYDLPFKASLLASRLESEGIESFIADGELVGMYGLLSGAVGGVKVQVREADAPRASAVARQMTPPPSAGTARRSPRCPRCSSADVTRRGLSVVQGLLIVFSLGVLALFFAARWSCGRCAHSWR